MWCISEPLMIHSQAVYLQMVCVTFLCLGRISNFRNISTRRNIKNRFISIPSVLPVVFTMGVVNNAQMKNSNYGLMKKSNESIQRWIFFCMRFKSYPGGHWCCYIPVLYRLAKSLQLIWRSVSCIFHSPVKMGCRVRYFTKNFPLAVSSSNNAN